MLYFIASCCFSVGIAIYGSYRSYKSVYVSVGLLGMIAGFFTGVSVYSIFIVISDKGSTWMMVALSVVSCLIGCYVAWNTPQDCALLGTSFIGSFAFVRGLSYIMGGFPAETTLFHGIKNDDRLAKHFNSNFWIYQGIFDFLLITSMWY